MSGETTRRKQILLVDDNADFLASTKAPLTELSHGTWEIFTAENHAAALPLLQDRQMDLVTLDSGMPVMGGQPFLRLLGRTHPGLQVVMLAGRASPEARKNCLELSAAQRWRLPRLVPREPSGCGRRPGGENTHRICAVRQPLTRR